MTKGILNKVKNAFRDKLSLEIGDVEVRIYNETHRLKLLYRNRPILAFDYNNLSISIANYVGKTKVVAGLINAVLDGLCTDYSVHCYSLYMPNGELFRKVHELRDNNDKVVIDDLVACRIACIQHGNWILKSKTIEL
jgi:hypothetical protein